ncbi:MAG: Sec-independent protein translocase protein TatB [Steroidobacteraceae bacterium]
MFFDFPEIVIIFGVGLVVLGPKKLPAAAAKVGHWVGRARTMARQFREQLEQEISVVDDALDTTGKRSQALKGTTPSSSTSPGESTAAADTGTAAAEATTEALPEDPYLGPAVDWQPDYGETEPPPAPYGDPSLIPEPDPAASQLSLELDSPAAPARSPAAPYGVSPPASAPAEIESSPTRTLPDRDAVQ